MFETYQDWDRVAFVFTILLYFSIVGMFITTFLRSQRPFWIFAGTAIAMAFGAALFYTIGTYYFVNS